jgi:mannose-1-phosphate guanylyltransferase
MGWSDVGEWIALKEALARNPEDNVIKGNVVDLDSKDSIIHNYEDDKLVATIGLEGFVVVNTKDVVAIFKKEDNARIKDYLKKLEGTKLEQYL